MRPSRLPVLLLAGTLLATAPLAPASLAQEPAAAPAPREADAVERFTVVSSDGTELAVEAVGDPDAPEILFIHGLRQSGLSWEKQFEDEALSRYRLVRFDLRGHGDSGKPTDAAAYGDPRLWADDLAAVIEGAGLDRPVLVGWSLGGYVAGAYLDSHGGEGIAGINLVDAVTEFSPETLTPLAGSFAESTVSDDLAERAEAIVDFLRACFERQPTEEEFEAMLVVNGMTEPAVGRGIVASSVKDLRPALARFEGPVLLSHGRHDALVTLAMSERARDASRDGELQVYEESGHAPFFEEPERFNAALAAFVEAAAVR